MGRLRSTGDIEFIGVKIGFPMIPPQVNGATRKGISEALTSSMFPMIPPQVNGATLVQKGITLLEEEKFPMIPPQVNGATRLHKRDARSIAFLFPMIPPQVNGATWKSLTEPDGSKVCFQ